MKDDVFAKWHKEVCGWNLSDDDYAKFKGEYRIRRQAWEGGLAAGQTAEREAIYRAIDEKGWPDTLADMEEGILELVSKRGGDK